MAVHSATNDHVGNKRRNNNWSDEEILSLCDVWKEYLNDLRSHKRNSIVYENMSKRLEEVSIKRTGKDIRTKLQNLAREYRKEKAKMTSGCAPSAWKFWDIVHSIIGNLPINDYAKIQESVQCHDKDYIPVESQNSEEQTTSINTHDLTEQELTITTSPISEAHSSDVLFDFSQVNSENILETAETERERQRRRRRQHNSNYETEVVKVMKLMLQQQKRSIDLAEEYDRKILQSLQQQTILQEQSIHIQAQMIEVLNKLKE